MIGRIDRPPYMPHEDVDSCQDILTWLKVELAMMRVECDALVRRGPGEIPPCERAGAIIREDLLRIVIELVDKARSEQDRRKSE